MCVATWLGSAAGLYSYAHILPLRQCPLRGQVAWDIRRNNGLIWRKRQGKTLAFFTTQRTDLWSRKVFKHKQRSPTHLCWRYTPHSSSSSGRLCTPTPKRSPQHSSLRRSRRCLWWPPLSWCSLGSWHRGAGSRSGCTGRALSREGWTWHMCSGQHPPVWCCWSPEAGWHGWSGGARWAAVAHHSAAKLYVEGGYPWPYTAAPPPRPTPHSGPPSPAAGGAFLRGAQGWD